MHVQHGFTAYLDKDANKVDSAPFVLVYAFHEYPVSNAYQVELFKNFTLDALLDRFICFHLATGEFPEALELLARCSARQ